MKGKLFVAAFVPTIVPYHNSITSHNHKENPMKLHRILLTVTALSAAVFSLAMTQPMMRFSTEERAKALKDSLNLSDEQLPKVKKILEEQQADMMLNFEVNQGDRDAIRKGMVEITEKTDKKIEAVLNAKQKKKYEEMKKRRQAMMREGMRQRREN
jgi:Spy/CpxP family protein refolding chaperone